MKGKNICLLHWYMKVWKLTIIKDGIVTIAKDARAFLEYHKKKLNVKIYEW